MSLFGPYVKSPSTHNDDYTSIQVTSNQEIRNTYICKRKFELNYIEFKVVGFHY